MKSEILEEDGWVDIWWPFEHDQYVSDPNDGWIKGDGVADDWFGIWGRDHTRLWQMSDGDVVANAHHDDPFPPECRGDRDARIYCKLLIRLFDNQNKP